MADSLKKPKKNPFSRSQDMKRPDMVTVAPSMHTEESDKRIEPGKLESLQGSDHHIDANTVFDAIQEEQQIHGGDSNKGESERGIIDLLATKKKPVPVIVENMIQLSDLHKEPS